MPLKDINNLAVIQWMISMLRMWLLRNEVWLYEILIRSDWKFKEKKVPIIVHIETKWSDFCSVLSVSTPFYQVLVSINLSLQFVVIWYLS